MSHPDAHLSRRASICTRCGLVQEFHDAVIEQRQKLLARSHGFAIVEHSHILYGRCVKPDCERLAGRQAPTAP